MFHKFPISHYFVLFVLLAFPLLSLSAVITKDASRNGVENPHLISNSQEFKRNEASFQPGPRNGRTIGMAMMSRLMDYFRNSDAFANIRNMFDNNNGVKKEWVPLGSLMFANPLGQKSTK